MSTNSDAIRGKSEDDDGKVNDGIVDDGIVEDGLDEDSNGQS